MSKCGIIVAMIQNRIIGIDGRIPWYYSADLRRFKKITIGTTIIMGRITWESLPKRPLPKRRNVVITNNPLWYDVGAECFNNLDDALFTVKGDSWIIGGGQIFRLVLQRPELIDIIDVTIVPDNLQSTKAIYFPEIDKNMWKVSKPIDLDGTEGVKFYRFNKY